MVRARRKWTAEEDAALVAAVKTAHAESRPLLWRELAKSVPGRSNKDCRRRWWNSLVDGTAKGPWVEEEDRRLIAAVQHYGTNWQLVSREVGSRNADQCSSHWSQVLDPNINCSDWTPEEDAHLLFAVITHGTNWATIAASHTPNRTTLALKNRYWTLRLKHNNKTEMDSRGSSGKSTPGTSNPLTATDWQQEPGRQSRDGTAASSREDEDDMYEDDDEDGEDDNEEDDAPDVEMQNAAAATSVPVSAPTYSDATNSREPAVFPRWGPGFQGMDAPSYMRQMVYDPKLVDDSRMAQLSKAGGGMPLYACTTGANDAGNMSPVRGGIYQPAKEDSMLELGPLDNCLDMRTAPGSYRPMSVSPTASGSNLHRVGEGGGTNGHGQQLHFDASMAPPQKPPSTASMPSPTQSRFINTNGRNSTGAPASHHVHAHGGLMGNPTDLSPLVGSYGSYAAAATYQVSIDMLCTGADLDRLLSSVTGIGSGLTIKIDWNRPY